MAWYPHLPGPRIQEAALSEVPAAVLQMCQDVIDQTVSFPLTGTVVNPDLVGVSLATTISLVANTTQTDRDTAIGQATAASQDYINNLGVGNQLVINDIAAAIRNSSPKILDVGEPNRHPFAP